MTSAWYISTDELLRTKRLPPVKLRSFLLGVAYAKNLKIEIEKDMENF